MFCNHCGNQIEEGTIYCPYCGVNQTEPIAPQQNYTPQQGYEPHQGYAPQQGYASQQSYAPQQDYTSQQSYAPQQDYMSQQGYASQQDYASQQGYAPQQGYASQQDYTSQQGYAYQQVYVPQQNYGNSSGKGNKKKKIAVAIVGIAVILAVVLLIKNVAGRSYKKTVKIYVKASLSGDAEELIDLMPEEMIDKTFEEEGFLNKEEMAEELEETLEEYLDNLDDYYGKGWKYSYEIVDETDYSISELRELRMDLKEDYDIRLDIEEAKEVEVELEVTSKDGETSNTTSMGIDVIKIGNKWYIWDI